MKTPDRDMNVLTKTPEEIKKALYLCSESGCPDCNKCAYDGNENCLEDKSKEALAYIQQLESRLAQVERERDAAVSDIPRTCSYCKHFIGYEYIPHCHNTDAKKSTASRPDGNGAACARKTRRRPPQMLTDILKIKGDWEEVANDCRSTVGKAELGREPSAQFKRGLLIAEHSPIRDISVKWRWAGVKSWIATHWVRHKWECFVKTQRDDRTGVPRDNLPQSAPVDFTGEANAQHLIDTMRKRLCHTAHAETRQYAEDLKAALHGVQPELADVLVPNCVYRCGCPEMNGCAFWNDFNDWVVEEEQRSLLFATIQQRYDLYNQWFYERHLPGRTEG